MRLCGLTLLTLSVVVTTPLTMGFQSASRRNTGARSEAFELSMPIGISGSMWRRRIPADNPLTRAKVSLGEMLYFDKRLSADGTVSCASCHDPANAFTDHSALVVGVGNKSGTRNAPTILNAMFTEQLFWDGRAGSLEEQAKQPIFNPFEMGMGSDVPVVTRLGAIPEYRRRFQEVFGDQGITMDTVVKAIAAYERTLLSANSPFDRFISGDDKALSESQKRGWELFKGKARCIECHSFSETSPFFTDFKFHNTGVVAKDMKFEQLSLLAKQIANGDRLSTKTSIQQPPESTPSLAHTQGFTELGRYLVIKQPKDIGAFKTPTLRDIELTTPYMHNGSEKTLIDVVRFYNRGGNANANANLDERMRLLHLSDEEINDLVEFMRALTSDDVLRQTQSSKPQSRTAVVVARDRVAWKARRRQ
jgi:cytochrome c peroxidase